MKSFKFRMQTILEQRQRQETRAMQDFASAQAAVDRAQKLLNDLLEVRSALCDELSGQHATDFDPFERQIYYEYMQTITQSLRDQEIYIRDLIATREALKIQMIGAARDHKAIATVKDRDKHAHAVLRDRIEQNLIDEMATARYVHRQIAQE